MRRPGNPAAVAPLLVVGSVISVQTGQAFGKQMFAITDPAGVVALRLGFAAVILALLWRPRLPAGRGSLGLIVALGTAIAGMNLIYPALTRLPLGVAATLQFLGPFTVALAGSRRLRDLPWAALAGLGVFLFYGPGELSSLTGVALALLSGAAMGGYVVLNKRAGARTRDGSFLTWAVIWAALICLPIGIVNTGESLLRPQVLATGAGMAALSAVVPYSLDLAALRRLPSRVVAVLESLEPVAAGMAGLLLLGEQLHTSQWLAIGCITAASIGATLTHIADPKEDQNPPAAVAPYRAEYEYRNWRAVNVITNNPGDAPELPRRPRRRPR